MSRGRWLEVLVVVILLVGTAQHDVQALSCAPTQDVVIAVCRQFSCTDEFVVRQASTGNGCDTRPVIVEQPHGHLKESLAMIVSVTHKPLEQPAGIYEVRMRHDCVELLQRGATRLPDSGGAAVQQVCGGTVSERVTPQALPEEIGRLRRHWHGQETSARRAAALQKWGGVCVIVLVTLGVIGWPWALRRRVLRSRGWLLGLTAVSLRVVWLVGLGGFLALLSLWSFQEWRAAALLAGGGVLLSMLWSLVGLICRWSIGRKWT